MWAKAVIRSAIFPILWAEWNGKYRDTVRSFWKGDEGKIGELAYRLTGSPDLYQHERPPPLREHQLHHRARRLHPERSRQLQRQAQRSQRRRKPRRRQQQSFLESRRRRPDRRSGNQRSCAGASGAISSPPSSFRKACRCSTAGDEWARTQKGNNNAYCQDNEISWLNWEHNDEQKAAARFHQETDPVAPRASGLPPAEILPGPPDSRLGNSAM